MPRRRQTLGVRQWCTFCRPKTTGLILTLDFLHQQVQHSTKIDSLATSLIRALLVIYTAPTISDPRKSLTTSIPSKSSLPSLRIVTNPNMLNSNCSRLSKRLADRVIRAQKPIASCCASNGYNTTRLPGAHNNTIQFQAININNLIQQRFFSSQPSVSSTPSTTRKDEDNAAIGTARYAALVREIKADLLEADVNSDGKMDAEELKLVLRKAGAFTDREILELSDLFYMGRGGASIKHEEFLEGIARIVGNNSSFSEDDGPEAANATSHRRTEQSKSHPLGVGSCSTEFMYGKTRGV